VNVVESEEVMEDLKKVVDDVEGVVTSAEAVVKEQSPHTHLY
jgi:hypothetical protein